MKIIMLLLCFLTLTGCKKEEVEIQEVVIEEKPLEELITIKDIQLLNNDVFFLITNNSDYVVDVLYNYTYLKEGYEDRKNRYKEVDGIPPKTTIIKKASGNIDYEDIYITKEIYKSNDQTIKKRNIIFTSHLYKKEIIVKLKNKKFIPQLAKVEIIFYKDNQVIDYEIEYIYLYESSERSFIIKNNKNYDRYDIFVE